MLRKKRSEKGLNIVDAFSCSLNHKLNVSEKEEEGREREKKIDDEDKRVQVRDKNGYWKKRIIERTKERSYTEYINSRLS